MSPEIRNFSKSESALVVIDIQELFRSLISGMDLVLANSSRLIRFCRALEIPTIVTEHYPAKLGGTAGELAREMPDATVIEKISFSCAGSPDFIAALEATRRRQVILCGIETHVCVYQTARDLLARGYQVAVIADAVSSRLPLNRQIGLERMRDLGAQIISAEMIMFEILEVALTDDFRKVSAILKENPGPA